MKKYLLWMVLGCMLLSIGALALTILNTSESSNTGYVSIQKLYDGFEMKNEMESDYKNIESRRKTIIDSLKIESDYYYKQNLVNNKLSDKAKKKLLHLQNQIKIKEEQFADENMALSKSYTDQVLKQLNQYVYDYGQENGYRYILGANNSGTIMYANNSEDISTEVLEYINKRYKGEQSK